MPPVAVSPPLTKDQVVLVSLHPSIGVHILLDGLNLHVKATKQLVNNILRNSRVVMGNHRAVADNRENPTAFGSRKCF